MDRKLEYRDTPIDANSSKLRELASWYREFAERAGNPVIWEARLRTAQDLETEADNIERRGIQSETPRPRRFCGSPRCGHRVSRGHLRLHPVPVDLSEGERKSEAHS